MENEDFVTIKVCELNEMLNSNYLFQEALKKVSQWSNKMGLEGTHLYDFEIFDSRTQDPLNSRVFIFCKMRKNNELD